jgi:hypothetical protein
VSASGGPCIGVERRRAGERIPGPGVVDPCRTLSVGAWRYKSTQAGDGILPKLAPLCTSTQASIGTIAMIIPHQMLSPEALHGVIEAFVTREGTDYGTQDVSLATN